MDIHRCRFVPFTPSPINALAFSHPSNPQEKTPASLRLALGRESGDVEIWNPQNGQWSQESILRGGVGKTIEQLVWTQDQPQEAENDEEGPLRLFSTGGSTFVTEWDLASGAPKRKAEGNFGDIWCFAAQPQLPSSEKPQSGDDIPCQMLAAGCGDGTIILFSTDDDDLRYLRPLVTAPVRKSKVLSITWRDRRTVVAGYEDSIIRVVDVPNRTVIRSMTLGKPADGNKSIVWTVKCLPDGTFLSGDSSGELKIWDSKNFSLVQRLKTHQADVLDIASNTAGSMLFTFGVDRRTVAYKPAAGVPGSKKQRWTETMHRRFHEHDVKCATTFESKDVSVMVSGGVDATPIVTPLRNWQIDDHRTLSHLPQRPQISSSPRTRIFLTWWEKSLFFYHIPGRIRNARGNISDDADNIGSSNYEFLATVQLKGDDHIQSAQISQDGKFVVVGTLDGVRLFQLRTTSRGPQSLRTRPIDLPIGLRKFGARHVGWSPDGAWLIAVRPDNTITLCKIIASNSPNERPIVHEQVVKLFRKPHVRSKSSLGEYLSNISCLSFSPDSRTMAVGDLSGYIDAWILEGYEDRTQSQNAEGKAKLSSDNTSDSESDTDSDDDDDEDYSPIIHGQKWIRNLAEADFPRLDSTISVLTFRPQKNLSSKDSGHTPLGLHATRHNPHPISHVLPSEGTRLIAITATNKLVEFDVLNGRLSDWSRRNPASQFPTDFTRIKDRVMGCFWDCSNPNKSERLWIYGTTWLFMLDVSKNLQPLNGEKIGRLGQYDVQEPSTNGKVKISNGPTRKKRKRNAGAGDKMRSEHRNVTQGKHVVKYKGSEQNESSQPTKKNSRAMRDNDDDDDDENMEDALVSLRRNASHDMDLRANGTISSLRNTTLTNGKKEGTPLDPMEETEDDNGKITALSSRPSQINQWCTFLYSSIFGIVTLSSDHPHETLDLDKKPNGANISQSEERSPHDDTSQPLEVAIIERPMHDVEQLPRFDGGQDWDA